ncbi:ATP-binding protein [Desulforamulus aeronauticus]|uniref:MinD superfamily P-loop ATPase, contains an inserted ferredoxin domain n=1 Tax=Desulforamulus aeronauticus DSM 10349 TaxID=1121421 RepID=A0A1M6TJM5_9FIRM|nr:ATP-binding protein [Desulforamulus aeronauticus]SHK57137.1 MinD superfamily P-loop ATPase, contains an inserted ferredoxin domain [Desulforamulus aeronauticus DSM 10349]
MKELTIISGKGGTGKTSILGAFATLAGSSLLCDCDVDAANLHILLNPSIKETYEFYGEKKAEILPELCTDCGKCEELCQFKAIQKGQINSYACEGCAVCYHVCPAEAIKMKPHLSGHWYISDTKWGPMVHAKLGIAQGNSGLLVNRVRKKAREVAKEHNLSLIISDGPPGIGCPVISSLAGTDMALVVTEPTASGIHDLERIVKVASGFGCITAVCINKYNLDEDNCRFIEDLAEKLEVPVIGKIPYDAAMAEAVLKGIPVTILGQGAAQEPLGELWQQVKHLLGAR